MLTSSNARPGRFAAIVSVLLSATALIVAVCREPLSPGFALRNPLNSPLDDYQFDTPKNAARSLMQMELNRDFRARLEYESRMDSNDLREQFNTFKVEKEVSFHRDTKERKRGRDGTGEFAILFVSYERKGEVCKEVVTLEKDRSGIWARRYLSIYDVRASNKALADEMDAWEGNSRGL